MSDTFKNLLRAAALCAVGAGIAGGAEAPERRVDYPTIIIEIYVEGGTKTGAEIRATGDSYGCYSIIIDNVGGDLSSYFQGERGRPLLNIDYLSIPSEEGKRFYTELTARLAAVKPRPGKADGDVVVSVTRFYPDSERQEVDEWPEAAYDLEPLLSFLRDLMAEHSRGEIGYLEGDGYVRLVDPESPKLVTEIKFSPLGDVVDVDVNDAAGKLRLPARVAARGGVCKTKLAVVDVYLFVAELRSTLELIAHPLSSPEGPEVEIFLPMDDAPLEYAGKSKVVFLFRPSFDVMEILNSFTQLCVKEAYYPEFTKKGLEFKKELQRRKKKGED